MYSLGQPITALPSLMPVTMAQQWFAIQTRSRHEKRVVHQLQLRGIPTFLPLITEVHDWSDRRKTVEVPLFSCYAFVRTSASPDERLLVLRTPGVLSFVGSNHHPTPVTDAELDNVKTVLASAARFSEYPFLKIGERVRVRGGALNGVEGTLAARNGERSLVISVGAIARSLLVRIEGYEVEPIPSEQRHSGD